MSLLSGVLDLLAPSRCLSCRRPSEPPWCGPCAREADGHRARGTCTRCGGGPGAGHPCWRAGAPIARTIAAFRYVGPVADAVVAAKVLGAHAAWPSLGRLLADVTAGLEVEAVTWVPAAARIVRRRGFDHARLLAAPVADRLGVPLVATLAARAHPDQGSRPIEQRRRLRTGTFQALRRPTGRIVLVDDVVTTGATAELAARALPDASVVLAVLARAGAHRLGAARP